jgi:hypothetical protein
LPLSYYKSSTDAKVETLIAGCGESKNHDHVFDLFIGWCFCSG